VCIVDSVILLFPVISRVSPQSERFSLQRNTDKCAHCGISFVRDQGPFVNRSDGKTFHLNLVSKPDLRLIAPGRVRPRQVICEFAYVRTGKARENRFVVVLISVEKHQGIGLREIEEAADKLAELLKAGEKPKAGYVIQGGALFGFPQ